MTTLLQRHRSAFFLFGLMTLLTSCEKNETVVQSDNKSFCPLNFIFYTEQYSVEGCGQVYYSSFDPTFKTENDGVVLRIVLKKENKPFFTGNPDPTNFYTESRAFHLTRSDSKFQCVFDKISMEKGARISFFLGKTRSFIPVSGAPFFGDDITNEPTGASVNNDWQIYIQRETDGTYTLGYVAADMDNVVKTGIADFVNADLRIENTGGKCVLTATLNDGNASSVVASVNTESLDLPAVPDNYFGALGFNIIQGLETECDDRPVVIKLKKYIYQSSNSPYNLEDNFECNTIWKLY